jgi:putative ABC transport system substrate-binding protein
MRRREFIALVAGAVARPRAALTQQPTKVYRIAIVHPSLPVSQMTETSDQPRWRALFQELRLLGYVEGQNLVVERYSGEGQVQNYARLAHDVVQRKPDLIYAISSRMVGHFKAATTTIPIVGLFAGPGRLWVGGRVSEARWQHYWARCRCWLRHLDQAA